MVKDETSAVYLPTIGIECHTQLKTKTKLFSSVPNDAREALPNTLISHICFGLPGSLPVLNEEAIKLACIASYALNTKPQSFSKFDRKHYFYPDLPKGYQITQFNHPIIVGGWLEIRTDGNIKKIKITRAHLEEDAGKNTHPAGKNYSLVDLNRAGTPLLEIVSEPDIHSAAEAKAFAREIYLSMRYADVSDANLYYGNMRFDVNVSVSKDKNKLGVRTETKNLNSFKAVEKAVEYEIDRQVQVLEKGDPIAQETRGWDDDKQVTFSQRSKEEAHDYRYFADPDLPPVLLSDDFVKSIEKKVPTLPRQWRHILGELGLEDSQIETLLDAHIELIHQGYLQLVEQHLDNKQNAKQLINLLVNVDIPLFREQKFENKPDRKTLYGTVIALIAQDKLSSTKAKELVLDLLVTPKLPADINSYAEEKGFIQTSNVNEINAIIDTVIKNNPKAVQDIQAGQTKVLGFLVGQVMRESKGKANPKIAEDQIKKILEL